jgi:hypothetical protein
MSQPAERTPCTAQTSAAEAWTTGTETGGSETGGTGAAGTETVGIETGGTETGGTETGVATGAAGTEIGGTEAARSESTRVESTRSESTRAVHNGRPSRVSNRISMDRDTVERDLMKLVLTVVELLRQLMERQALRRVEQGDLDDDQEERIGLTLMLLEERMTELCDRYGLSPSDLNIDLGPLGPLLPR